MKTSILIITFLNLAFLSACDSDDTPTMSTCILYGDDPVACEEAGCTVMGGGRAVYRDGRCVAFVPFGCFPAKSDECASVDHSYCSIKEDSIDVVFSNKSCPTKLDGAWETCPHGYGFMTDCYPDPTRCATLTTVEECHAEYCTWIQGAVKAIFEGGLCTGWEATPVSFCTVFIDENRTKIFRETVEGTELYRIGDVQYATDTFYFKISNAPDPWSSCVDLPSVDDPICASCPEPAK